MRLFGPDRRKQMWLDPDAGTRRYPREEEMSGIQLPPLTADPDYPQEGDLWPRSDVKQYRGRIGGSTVIISGSSGTHDPVTIGADGEHTLAGQVLSGTPAQPTQVGHLRLAGHLGGSYFTPLVTGHSQITGTSDLHTEYLKKSQIGPHYISFGSSPVTGQTYAP